MAASAKSNVCPSMRFESEEVDGAGSCSLEVEVQPILATSSKSSDCSPRRCEVDCSFEVEAQPIVATSSKSNVCSSESCAICGNEEVDEASCSFEEDVQSSIGGFQSCVAISSKSNVCSLESCEICRNEEVDELNCSFEA